MEDQPLSEMEQKLHDPDLKEHIQTYDSIEDHDGVQWLRDLYPVDAEVTDPIYPEFKDDDGFYILPRDALLTNFNYFLGALRLIGPDQEPFFMEGVKRQVTLQEVSTGAFGRIIAYTQGKNAFAGCRTIDHFLDAVMASDYLALEKTGVFEKYVNQHLKGFLLRNRKELTAAHLHLVRNHPAFRSRAIWVTFARAGVRPFLQQYMLGDDGRAMPSEDYLAQESLGPLEEWRVTVGHFRRLFGQNDFYLRSVGREVDIVKRVVWRQMGRWCNKRSLKNFVVLDPLYWTPMDRIYLDIHGRPEGLESSKEHQFRHAGQVVDG